MDITRQINLLSARAEKLFVLCNFFGHNVWSGSSTSPPAVALQVLDAAKKFWVGSANPTLRDNVMTWG
eukprot:1343031-Pyramimonas_sp.AAC.1